MARQARKSVKADEPRATAKVGRPLGSSDFADDQITELLDRIAEGEPLRKICADPRMPSKSTVYAWLDDAKSEFFGRFHARKRIGVHTLAEECLEIADDAALPADQKRIKIDTRLRLAGKWLPREYGDKVTHEHGGKDGQPIQHDHRLRPRMTKEEWLAEHTQ